MTRLFWPLAFLLLAVMAVLMIHAAVLESQTWDEGIHLVAGFSYWKTGDFRLNMEHPPLTKLLAAIPLLFTSAEMPASPEAWRDADTYGLSQQFLYRNKVSADSLLLRGRMMTVLVTVVLGAMLAAVARRRWGPVAGLTALALYATDPNFLAHGHYVTSDVAASLGIFATAFTWERYLSTGRRRDLVIASLVLGLALAAKFSALYLVAVCWLVFWPWRAPGVRRPLVACAGAALVVLTLYGIQSWPVLRGRRGALADKIPTTQPTPKLISDTARELRLPAHPFLIGAWFVFEHNQGGHISYLRGKISDQGSHLYFPIAFAVKTPSSTLLLAAIALVTLAFHVRRVPWRTWLLVLYPALYVASSVGSRLNLGLRHLLPAYPFLYLFIGWAVATQLAGRWRRASLALLAGAACLQVGELARAAPHYTAFFNSPSGGPANGYRHLLDSNLDWGQDVKKLKHWMDERGLKEVCLSYFGSADLRYYGINEIPLMNVPPAERSKLDCMAAVSVTNMFDLYTPPGTHAWLFEKKPVDHIGHSLWIFDLRRGRHSP